MTHNSANVPAKKAPNAPAREKDGLEVGYTSHLFVQALFPYRKSEDQVRTVTQQGTRISILSSSGLPYGKYPRLFLAHLITLTVERSGMAGRGEITHEEARRIPLGSSMTEFMEEIGIASATGGKNGTIGIMREQIRRLSTSTITVEHHSASRDSGMNTPIARKWLLWYDKKTLEQADREDSSIELTEDFYNQVVEHPVPINLLHLHKLNRPRAMDIYTWLARKKYWINHSGHDEWLYSWADLAHNFSPTPITTRYQRNDFKKEIRLCVEQILKVWPQAGIEVVDGGLHMRQGPTPIPIKQSKRAKIAAA